MEDVSPPKFNKPGKTNIIKDDLLQEINWLLEHGYQELWFQGRWSFLLGTEFWKLMIQTLCPNLLVTLFYRKLSQRYLTINGLGKRKITTGKVEPSAQLLAKEKFSFQKTIPIIVYDHDMPVDFFISLGQTPLSYLSLGKCTQLGV